MRTRTQAALFEEPIQNLKTRRLAEVHLSHNKFWWAAALVSLHGVVAWGVVVNTMRGVTFERGLWMRSGTFEGGEGLAWDM